MQIKVQLRPFLTKEARNLTRQYKRLITVKRGVSQDSAPHNKQSTIKSKGFDHWLVNTGETKNKSILFRASKSGFIVFASGAKHSGRRKYVVMKNGRPVRTVIKRTKSRPKYKELFEWHNKKSYSGIFEKLPVGSTFPQRLDKELKKQIEPQITNIAKKTLLKFKGVRFV